MGGPGLTHSRRTDDLGALMPRSVGSESRLILRYAWPWAAARALFVAVRNSSGTAGAAGRFSTWPAAGRYALPPGSAAGAGMMSDQAWCGPFASCKVQAGSRSGEVMSAGCGSACRPCAWRRNDPRAAPIPLEDSRPCREETLDADLERETTGGSGQQGLCTSVFYHKRWNLGISRGEQGIAIAPGTPVQWRLHADSPPIL